MLARKDFQVRYKRATLGILWAVAVPLLQALVFTIVFSRFANRGGTVPYGAFVLTGVLAWSYFSASLSAATTSIVDGASLTDKIWFPRASLAIVPALSGLVGLGISAVLLLVALPITGADLGGHTLLLLPACVVLVLFTGTLGLVTAAAQVYFRDVRFVVGAGLQVLLYCTPILYTKATVGRIAPWLDLNPLTGIVALFHLAAIGPSGEAIARPLAVTAVTTVVLALVSVEVYRRHDRLFVDLL